MGWNDDWPAAAHQPLLSVRTEADEDDCDHRQSCGTPHRGSLATLHEDEAFSPPPLSHSDGHPVKWPSQSSIAYAAQEGAPELTFIIRTQSRVGAVDNSNEVITNVNVTEAVQDVVQDVLQVCRNAVSYWCALAFCSCNVVCTQHSMRLLVHIRLYTSLHRVQYNRPLESSCGLM